jgi:hypothetical protein
MKLGVAASVQTGEWDSTYANEFNVRFIGLASGDRLYSSSTTGVNSNLFVLRKAKPVVTRQTLSTNTLANGLDQDLYRMQIAAEGTNGVSVKRITWDFSKTGSTTLANFRIRKGSSDMALGDIQITNGTGVDLEAGTLSAASSTGRVIVTFTNEETITGSGAVYTLHATVGGSVAGDTVSFTPARDNSQTVVTGYLDDGFSNLNSIALYGGDGTVSGNLNTNSAGGAGANATNPGSFVWSDLSEVPHSFADVDNAGSDDWTNDVYVDDLTQAQTLTR